MTSWKKVKLGDVADVKGGKRLPKGDELNAQRTIHPYIRVTDMGSRFIDKNQLLYVSESTFKSISRYIVNTDDIIVSIVGTIGAVAKIDRQLDNASLTENCVKFHIKNKYELDSDFLYYFLISDTGQNEIAIKTVGSTQPKLPIYNIKDINISLPDYPTQTRIASILTALDEKIELNHQMNHTLEQMAQAIFKKYFVDDIDPENLPDGWRMGKLIDVLELNYGKALKEEERIHGKFPVVGSSGIVGWHNKSLAKGPGVVVGRKGNAGAIIWIRQDFFPIDTTYFVIDKLGVADLFYTHILLQQYDFKNQNADSAVPGLNRNEAYNNGVIVPHTVVVEKFNNLVKPMYGKMMKNAEEIDSLQITRDSILPKLMSGEIEIKEAETILE